MAIDSEMINGFTVTYDHDPAGMFSPRDDYCHGCEMVMRHKRYSLPNDAGLDLGDFSGWKEVRERILQDGALIVLPVYMLDHSGVALSVTPFGDRWDSGQIGVAFVTRENWADTQGTDWTGSEEQLQRARELITGDVRDYSMYLGGEVYGYVVTDTDGEVMDSSGGFLGWDAVREAASEMAHYLVHDVKCNGELNRRTGEVDHEGPCPVHDKEDS
jgi:hypothetical protein